MMKVALRLLTILVASACAALGLAGDITLRLSTWEGDVALGIQREAIKGFEAAHPGIHVKLENNDMGLYFQKLLTQYAANTAPDVAMMGFERFQAFASRGVLLPLDDYAANSPGFDLKEYYPGIVQAHRYGGKLYVLPRDIAPMGIIYYNKKAFDEAGIPYPDGSWTFDYQERPELKEKDFLWVLHKLTKFGPDGKVQRWAFAPGWMNLLADTVALSTGARPVDNYEHPTKILYNSPEMVRAFEFVDDLIFRKKYIPSNTEVSAVLQTNTREMFESQKVAMFMCGIWEVPNVRRSLVPGSPKFFDWDITMFPAFKDGTLHFPSGGSGYSILSSTKHPKECWELLRWMAGREGMKGLAENGLAQPAIQKLATSEPWIPGPNTPIEKRYPPSRLVTDQAVSHVVFPPTSQYWPDLQGGYINPRTDSIWTHERTAQESLDQGTREAQARLDTLNKEEALPPYNWAAGLVAGIVLVAAVVAWVYWPERKVKRTSREKQENLAAYKFIAPWIFGTVVLLLGPMVLSLLMSFSDWDIIQPARWRGLANYHEALWVDPRFWGALRVTAVYTVFAVPLGLVGSLLLALLLNQPIKGMPVYRTIYYLPTITSAVASVMIWMRLFKPEGGLINMLIYGSDGKGNFLGLADFLSKWAPPGQQINWLGSEKTALGALVIMSLWGIGGGMIILLAGLQGIPQHYYEAAMLDGANAFKRFRNVTVPLLTPALFFSLVTSVIGSFQVFTQSFVMTAGGPGDSTRFFMLHLYDQAFNALRMGYASSLAWVLFIIILVLTMVQFRMSKWVYSEGAE